MLLISLPLAFQLGLSFFMLEQLQDAERKFEQELHRMRIIASLDEVQHLHLRCLAAAAFYSIHKDEVIGERHLAGLKQLAAELKHLKELTQNEPTLLAQTQELQQAVLAVVPYEMMMRRMSLMEGKLHLSESMKARKLIKESMQLIESYQAKLIPPIDDVDSFRRSAFEMEMKLGAALALILLESLLFLYLSQKYVLSVIDVLSKQIENFKDGEPLRPVIIDTKDEIAELEKVLCDSANRITSLEGLRQELCSIVSHDIRAPMTSIGGLVTLLEVGALGELSEEHEALNQRLKVSSEDLLNVLNNILDLDKLRSNKWPLSIHSTPNEEVCRKIQKEFESAEYLNVVTHADPGAISCDADALARALLAIAQVFIEKASAVKIDCTVSGGCTMTLQGEAKASGVRDRAALSLAQLFCEKQSAKLSQSSLTDTTVFSIVPDVNVSNQRQTQTILEQVQIRQSKTKEKRPYSRIGKSLLFLIGRPLAVSITAIGLLIILLTGIGKELGKELVSRKIVHATTSLSSDMTHLMLLSIRRTSTELEDEEQARSKISNKIDADVQALRELGAKTNISMSNELELVQHKVDSLKSLSKEMTSKPLDQLGSTLKKLVAGGELSSVVFSKAGSLLTTQAESDSVETLLKTKYSSYVLLILVGASIVTALFTLFGAIEVSRGFIARLNNVAENARRLTRREPLREPLKGNDEIANLDTFFFESALKIAQLEVERKELSVLLREQLKAPLLFLGDGFSKILNEAIDLADKGKTLIQRTVVEIRRLNDLADDLLLLDTIEESGQLKLDVEIAVTSVTEIVNRSIDAVTPQAKLKGLDIIFSGEQSVMVRADASRSIQILVNLLSNAVKFSPDNETVTVTSETSDGNVRIIVTDRGRGIPESEAHRLFSRFDQMSKDDNRKGSGLGLFISKKLAEAQNGNLDFESKEGAGSKFWLTLPDASPG